MLIKIKFLADTIIRNNEMHHHHLAAISGPGHISSSVFGVEKRCPLLDLPYFNVLQSFPPDIMHNMLEGTVPQLVSLMLLKFKVQNVTTAEQMKTKLNIFEIDRNDWKNKPVHLLSVLVHLLTLLVLHHRSFVCFGYYRLSLTIAYQYLMCIGYFIYNCMIL